MVGQKSEKVLFQATAVCIAQIFSHWTEIRERFHLCLIHQGESFLAKAKICHVKVNTKMKCNGILQLAINYK